MVFFDFVVWEGFECFVIVVGNCCGEVGLVNGVII